MGWILVVEQLHQYGVICCATARKPEAPGSLQRYQAIQKVSSAIRISSSVEGRDEEDVVVRLQGVGGFSLELPVCIIDEY